MNAADLKTKCSRAMIESGPEVMVRLTIPDRWEATAEVVSLSLVRGGPMARVVGRSVIGDKKMVDVNVKAALVLKALQELEAKGA